ncbi:hypothetical protein CW356_11245 [Streptococcus pneumoniae]|nr:hypothetical protein CW356_11245 [Streptococcus pneumoniae]
MAGWPWNQWSDTRGMGGRITVESVVRCSWNGWPDDRGIRILAALCFVCLLVEPPGGGEPSLPDGSDLSSEGAVRVATKIAVLVSGSPVGSESL